MNSSRNVGLSCGLWSLIGTFVALAVVIRFHFHLAWVIPASLIAGLGAYLTYDLIGFVRSAKQTWRETRGISLWDEMKEFVLEGAHALVMFVILQSLFFWIISQFFWKVFVLTHCKPRMICLVDTAFGMLIGFVVGLACWDVLIGSLVGGVAGAGLGVLSCHLVSIGWLKLEPELET